MRALRPYSKCIRGGNRNGAVSVRAAVRIVPSSGGAPLAEFDGKGTLGGTDGVKISTAGVHVTVDERSPGKVFVTDVESSAGVSLNGNPLRPGVAYLCPPAATLALGGGAEELTIEFEAAAAEAGAISAESLMAEAFKRSFAAGASEDVKSKLEDM
mmetsp:Transcript_17374/g.56868  ORF Transcript_17374/g.56868 Transcript_17374/m.56868 type:complete len:156 (-) Transcript_17374:150-617(-)